MARDSFEVYYYQGGRWSLHASYEADAREEAIAEAQNVEAKLGYPARVIKETFYPETNTSEESIAWQGVKGKKIADADNMFGTKQAAPAKPAAKKAAPPSPPPRQERKAEAPAPRPAKKPVPVKPKKRRKEKGFFAKLFTSLLVSSATAVVAAAALALLILQLQSMKMIEAENRTPLIIGTFVMLFFVSLLVSLNKQFSLLGMVLSGAGTAKPRKVAMMQSPMMRMATATPAPAQDAEFDRVEIERGEEADAETDDGDDDADDLPPDLDADMSAEQETIAPPAEPEPAPAPMPDTAPPPPQPQVVPAPEPPPAAKPEAKKPAEPKPEKKQVEASPAEAEARQIFAGFVTEAHGNVRQELGELNAFSRFGMSLLLAGAVSSLGQAKRLGREPQLGILKQGLTAIGNTPDRTQTFCAELPGYGKNPRYTGMIQSGSKAMSAYMAGSGVATQGIGALLSEWSKPEKRAAVPSVYTFMFTDIVGSTAMTQQLGNVAAQKVVRAHNTAVRNALAKFKGREVKHTGDGIMAVFTDAPSAVQAAIQMLRDIVAHNVANPNLPLTVRIGLNAGEAV